MPPRPTSTALLLVALTLQSSLITPAYPQVVFNEIMASNRGSVTNGGTYPDWLELYNSGTDAAIGGWIIGSFEDNGGFPRKTNFFRFPAGTIFPAGQRLVVWCDRDTNAPGFHTGYVLDRTGCALSLFVPPSFTVTSSVSFGLQLSDRSIGRVPDGPAGTWTLNVPTPGEQNVAEPLGPIEALRINEWAASNTVEKCTSDLDLNGDVPFCPDWIELYNTSSLPVPLAGLYVADRPTNEFGKMHAFTNLSFIEARGFQKLLCDDQRKPPGRLNFKLSSANGQTLRIYTADRRTIIDEVSFPGNSQVPGYWPGDTSYGRFPDGGPIDPRMAIKPTPGEPNFYLMTNVVINEVLAHTSSPLEDAIELFNTTDGRIDLSGWWISDDKDTPKKFRVPPGTAIDPRSYYVFYEMRGVINSVPRAGFNTHAGALPEDFALNSMGEDVWIFSAINDVPGTLTGFRGSLTFDAAESGVSLGPVMNSVGVSTVVPLSGRTFGVDSPATVEQFRQGRGAPNTGPHLSPLVITEIYYHPPDFGFVGTNFDNIYHEFVEIYNRSLDPVPLYDLNNYGFADGRTNTWRLGGQLQFPFPTNMVLAPGEFIVALNFSPTNAVAMNDFINRFQLPPGVRVIGPYSNESFNPYRSGPGLTNDGATLALQRPDAPEPPGDPDAGTVPYVSWDRIDYDDAPPWPPLADGATNIFDPSGIHIGYSLQRIVVENYGNDPINWIAATPTPGRQPIRLEIASRSDTNLTLRVPAWAGASYTVEHAPTLSAETWTVLTNIPASATSGIRLAGDPQPPGAANRFYRARSP